MAWYKAQWSYRSSLWHEPIEAGKILDLTEEQAAMLNADSPGVVKPVTMAEVEDKPKARVVEEPPKTTAKTSPARRAKSSDE